MASRHHLVRFYGDPAELADIVAAYLAEGLAGGSPGVLIATAEHRNLVLERLGGGHERLAVVDAEALVADGAPSAGEFECVVGGLFDELAERYPGREIRAFGEAVDVLSSRGEYDDAISLEELWNSLAWSRRFSLLCAYRRDRFDGEAGAAALEEVRRTHAHVVGVAA